MSNLDNFVDVVNGIRKKKRHYIYLAGNISENNRTYEWREEFTEYMKSEPNAVIINPCANKFNQGMKNATPDGLSFIKEAVKRSQKILRAKDYQLIKISSLVVAHLGFVTANKPLIGTIQELTWAHDIFYTPIIGVTSGEDNAYTRHPWIDECCSAKVETVEEAANMVKDFFLEF
jgi:hypothetical protein